jgi:hypothetical protein
MARKKNFPALALVAATTLAGVPMFRQGDVAIVRVGDLPPNITPRKRDRGRVVLAYGEITGHAHAITDKAVVQFDAPNATEAARQLLASVGLTVEISEHNQPSFLDVPEGATIEHEEHTAIALDPGKYVIIRQREYAPEALRSVAD